MPEMSSRTQRLSARELDREIERIAGSPKELARNLTPFAAALSAFLDGAAVTIYFYDEESRELVLRGTTLRHRPGGDTLRQAADGTPSGLALEERRVVSLAEPPRQAPRGRQAEEHVFPLESRGRKLGSVAAVRVAREALSPARLDMARRALQRFAEFLAKARDEEALQLRMSRLAAVSELGVVLMSTRNGSELPSLATATVCFLLGAEGCILRLRDEKTGESAVRDTYGLRDAGSTREILQLEDAAAREVLASRSPLVVGDAAESETYRRFSPTVKTFMALPVCGAGGAIGTITAVNKQTESVLTPSGFVPEDCEAMLHLVQFLEKAIGNATEIARSRELSDRDALTGLPDLSSFRSKFLAEVSRARRFNQRFALVTCEVPPLEAAGGSHARGDGEVLCGVARAIRSAVREYDVVARLGERTFGILLPQLQDGMVSPVARVRAAVEKEVDRLRELGGEELPEVRLSHAVFPDDGATEEQLLPALPRPAARKER